MDPENLAVIQAQVAHTKYITSFLTEHQLLNTSQFGYLEGRSTVSQLLDVIATGAYQEIHQKCLM